MGICHADNPKALTKRKELDLHMALTAADIGFEYQKYMPFKGCGIESESTRCFVDFVLYKPWGVLLLECDEDQHSGYPVSCDVRRDFDICSSLQLGSQHKAVMLRYNPDSFRVAGVTRRTSKRDRLTKLIETLRAWDVDPAPSLGFARFFLFYDTASDDAYLPLVAKDWDPLACEISSRVR